MCYSCCTHCIHHITFNVLQAVLYKLLVVLLSFTRRVFDVISQDTDYYIKSFYLLVFYKLQ